MRLTSWFVVFLLASNCLCQQPVAKDSDPAVAAARKRQEQFKTVEIKFKRTEMDAAGSRSSLVPSSLKLKGPVPAKDTISESTNRIVLDGTKARFENNHPSWHLNTGNLQEISKLALTNGNVAKMFLPKGLTGTEPPSGKIEKSANVNELSEPFLKPFFLAFRGLDPLYCSFPLSKFKSTGVKLPIDKADCTEYLLQAGNAITRCWLDPAKKYSIRRITTSISGKLNNQMDVQLVHDKNQGWMPATWTMNQYSKDGNLMRSTTIEFLETLINKEQSSDQFEFRFPAGTYVYDLRSNKEYKIQENETMRELTVEGNEVGGNVPQPGDGFLLRNRWLISSVGFVTVVVLSYWAIMKKMRRSS